jgi:hypothetical protein
VAGESNEDLGCHLVDDGSSQLIAVEAADSNCDEPQALWVRVGVVYDKGEARAEPGIWVNYQERYMAGPLAGIVLLTPAVWAELTAAVDELLSSRGMVTRTDKFMRAVRAVHAKYKAGQAEITLLEHENEQLKQELAHCRAGIQSQNYLVKLAEDVLRPRWRKPPA